MSIYIIEQLVDENNDFSFPSGICFHIKRKLFYLTDMNNHRICELDINGQVKPLSFKIKNYSVESFDKPLAICCNNGNLYVTDAGLNAIFVKEDENDFWEILYPNKNVSQASVNLPGSITADETGDIYFTDFQNNSIKKLDIKGNLITLIGGNNFGYKDGKIDSALINRPYGIFYHDKKLYFVDTENHKIRFIDLIIKKVFTVNWRNSSFNINRPIALALDNIGNIFICEQRRMLYYNKLTNKIDVLIDKDFWKKNAEKFRLTTRVCHIGAMVVTGINELYWVDTIKGNVYKVLLSDSLI